MHGNFSNLIPLFFAKLLKPLLHLEKANPRKHFFWRESKRVSNKHAFGRPKVPKILSFYAILVISMPSFSMFPTKLYCPPPIAASWHFSISPKTRIVLKLMLQSHYQQLHCFDSTFIRGKTYSSLICQVFILSGQTPQIHNGGATAPHPVVDASDSTRTSNNDHSDHQIAKGTGF